MRVLKDFNNHTAIEVTEPVFRKHNPDAGLIIKMDAEGLTITEVSPEVLRRDWSIMDYPVHVAAMHYLEAMKYIGLESHVLFYLRRTIMQYIIDKTGGTILVGNAKEVKAEFSKLPEEQRLQNGAFIIKGAEDLTQLSLSALATLYNTVVEDDKAVKRFGDKAKATVKVWEAMELNYDPKVQAQAEKAAAKAAKDAVKAEAAKTKGEAGSGASKTSSGVTRADSKTGKLLACLQDGQAHTLTELSEVSGYDEQNARTCVGLLRSKKGLAINYDRESKSYTLAQ